MGVQVSLSPSPILQFFDNTGAFASGGSVLTQVGGVNYPTYSDAAGTTALPNPIPLNSRGEISTAAGASSTLYLQVGVTYTFIISDKNGNVLDEAQVTGNSGGSASAVVVPLPNTAALAAATAATLTASVVQTVGYYSPTLTSAPDGGGGVWNEDASDVTSGAVFTGSIAPNTLVPAAPSPGQVGSGGAINAGTYYVKVTYVSAVGETTASPETSIAVGSNSSIITVPSPSAQPGATGYKVYISTTSGAEQLQTANAVAIGTTADILVYLTGQPTPPSSSTFGGLLTVTATSSGTVAINQRLFNNGVTTGTYVTGGSGSTWAVNISQTLASGAFTASDGETYIVDLSGRRWKRNYYSPQYKITYAPSNYIQRFIDPNGNAEAQLIGIDIEQALNQSGTNIADQFGQTTELFTLSSNSAVWNGELTSVYGSVSHFGNGAMTNATGGGFEAFNSGTGIATSVVGVSGNAWNGGVSAGVPVQNPTNNGSATNLRGVTGFVGNLSAGAVTNAANFYGLGLQNSGGGTITNLYGLILSDMTGAVNNYAISTGRGIVKFGDALQVVGNSNLPSSVATNFTIASGFPNPTSGRLYVGDGSGYQLEFASRLAGIDKVVAELTDTGMFTTTGGLAVNKPSGVIGYAAGAGSSIIQSTSKGTTVTLNASTGVITTSNSSLASGSSVFFNFFNSSLKASSILVFSIQSGSTASGYIITADNMQGGVCDISIYNKTSGALAEAIVINYAIINASSN